MKNENEEFSIIIPKDFQGLVKAAVGFFWQKRKYQASNQGSGDQKDKGARSAVTGGKQMSGFENLIHDILVLNGIPSDWIHIDSKLELPGYFRPTKKWDLLVINKNHLISVVEMKSQVGPSFGNNFNNRTEEAVGSATDILTAYRENAFSNYSKPWLGYLFMLEDCSKSRKPVSVNEPHFSVFPEFKNSSYSRRYEELCRKLMLENLYSRTTFFMSRRDDFIGDTIIEPVKELEILKFIKSLVMHTKLEADI